jgi:hypothetical protein
MINNDKSCQKDSCEAKLRKDNKSGYCRAHAVAVYRKIAWQKDCEKIKAQNRNQYYKNRESRLKKTQIWQVNHPGYGAIASAKFRSQHPEKVRQNNREQNRLHPESRARIRSRRKAAFKFAIVQLTEYEQFLVSLQYSFAQWMTNQAGIRFTVDHYFPLQGKCCRGKHHPSNLRTITAVDNARKCNKCPLHGL